MVARLSREVGLLGARGFQDPQGERWFLRLHQGARVGNWKRAFGK